MTDAACVPVPYRRRRQVNTRCIGRTRPRARVRSTRRPTIAPAVQSQTLTDQYSQDIGFLITRPILPNDPNGAALKLAVDLRDREEVAVRLLPRGPTVRAPTHRLMTP